MSRIPSFRSINLDLSGPLAQRAEASRVGGQLLSAKTPQEAQAFLGGAYQAADASALAFNNALFDATQGGYRQLQADQTTAQDAIAGGYGDLAKMIGDRNRGLSGGYEGALGSLQSGNQGIAGGYGSLQNAVLGDIQGIGRTRAMDIEDAYARSLGAQQQRMISSGLGNSTVLNAIDRGLMTDRMRAQIANDESVSGLRARYRSDLGQAGLQFRERGLGAETDQRNRGLQFGERALGMEADQGNRGLQFDERGLQRSTDAVQNQLNWMNTIQAPYPDAGMYAQLAQQYGAAQQAQADRDQMMSLAAQDRALADRMMQQGVAGGYGSGGPTTMETPTFGGGYARGVGGLAPPMGGTLGGTVLQGAGGPSLGVGAAAFSPASSAVYSGALQGAGGGGGMQSAGSYTGYGGFDVSGAGFGGGAYGSALGAGSGVAGYLDSGGSVSGGSSGLGAYGGGGGFGGGFGSYGGAAGGGSAQMSDFDWDVAMAGWA